MFKFIDNFFKRNKMSKWSKELGFDIPSEINEAWLSDLSVHKQPKEVIASHFATGWDYIYYEKGMLMPFYLVNEKIVWYKVLGYKKHGSSMPDYAGWDDGKQFDLVFDHVGEIPERFNELWHKLIFVVEDWKEDYGRVYRPATEEDLLIFRNRFLMALLVGDQLKKDGSRDQFEEWWTALLENTMWRNRGYQEETNGDRKDIRIYHIDTKGYSDHIQDIEDRKKRDKEWWEEQAAKRKEEREIPQ